MSTTKVKTCATCGTELSDSRKKYCSEGCKQGETRKARLLRVAKRQYTVPEVAEALAQELDIKADSARVKLYRAIERGDLLANSYLGSKRIPYLEVKRILEGGTDV